LIKRKEFNIPIYIKEVSMNKHRWSGGMILGLLASTLLIGGAGQVRAQALYDNLAASTTLSDPIASFGPLADSFSTGGSAVVINDLKLLLNSPTSNSTFDVRLLSDSSTSPGSLIAVLGTIPESSIGTTNTIIDVPFSPISLNANTRYWIQLTGADGSVALWAWSSDTSGPGVAGEFFANSNGVFTNDNGPYQMQLLAAVPEPTTWALIGVGTLGTGIYAWRKKRLAIKAGMAKLKR
jgi:PEP-CTERM motif